MDLWELVVPLGLLTYALLVLMLLTGKRIIKVKPKVHGKIGVLTLTAATLHVGIIIYSNYF